MTDTLVLLTGGSGFLGSHIAEALDQQRIKTRAFVRPSSDVRHLATLRNVELAYGSFEDPETLRSALKGVTHVLHCAGVVKARSREDFFRVNAGGTEALVNAALTAEHPITRFVLVSSLTVAGPSKDGSPVSMDARPNPVTDYGRSKLAAEQALLAHREHLPSTVLRPGAIYGPRDTEILAFFKAVKLGVLPLTGSPTQGVSLIYGPDCAAACVKALFAEVPTGSVYCVEDGETLPLSELVKGIEAAMHKRVLLRVPIPRSVLYGAALGSELGGRLLGRAMMLTRDKCNELLAPHWVCDASKTRRALDWAPSVDFKTGARLTAEWYRRHRWL